MSRDRWRRRWGNGDRHGRFREAWSGSGDQVIAGTKIGNPVRAVRIWRDGFGGTVGGIGELISEQTGWPVLNQYDAREYADRIRDVLSSSRDAMKRSDALGRLIQARHSFEGFRTDVRKFVEEAPHRTSIAAE